MTDPKWPWESEEPTPTAQERVRRARWAVLHDWRRLQDLSRGRRLGKLLAEAWKGAMVQERNHCEGGHRFLCMGDPPTEPAALERWREQFTGDVVVGARHLMVTWVRQYAEAETLPNLDGDWSGVAHGKRETFRWCAAVGQERLRALDLSESARVSYADLGLSLVTAPKP